ncbi:MAG: cyclopropane fatty acyl phospholipid synthase [Spirochaetes bacterium]|nr:cyclopropane fatty acyl phospholipid synthase [Spirochaetota bacterium]
MTTKQPMKLCEEIFGQAGISINGNQPFDIHIKNQDFYQRVLAQSAMGLGESYMDGWWDCNSIDQFIEHLLKINIESVVKNNLDHLTGFMLAKIFNKQNLKRAFEVGEKHYDVGNDLYIRMLDKRMNYTCGYWKEATTLDEAQEAKLDLVCRKTGLDKGMRVLELGCGWGAFAQYASENYGAIVTGCTVSKEQTKLARERCRGLPVSIVLEDYRKMRGEYDRVISIGIMEHVGYKNYRAYMETVDRCLVPDGLAFIHTIGGNKTDFRVNTWTDKYIFPNGMLPSLAQLSKAMEGLFIIEDLHNIGPDYDPTLMCWYDNFEKSWEEIKTQYNDRFYRMWKYYLLSCAGGFRARSMQLWQIVLTRPGTIQPDCRKS